MYVRKTKSWIKHIDFILLDVLCLQLAFVLAYITRHGWTHPSAENEYLMLAITYAFSDFFVLIAMHTMKNVLKRGYYIEFTKTFKQTLAMSATVLLFMFSTQTGMVYSRITVFLTAIYYFMISYIVRVVWKKVIRRKMRKASGAAIYFVTTYDRAESVIENFRKNDLHNCLIQGVGILDQDCIGEYIVGIPVTATQGNIRTYLRDKWVDEVFVSIPSDYPYPKELISVLVEMGIVVHVEMNDRDIEEWQHQAIEKVAGSTVRTISMTMASDWERFMKRTIDIIGGLAGCVVTVLLMIVIGPLIYIKSPGPIFFKQTRVGKNGKLFKMYKFRSMYLDAEERKAELMAQNRVGGGLMFKLDYDPRIIGCQKLPDGTIKKGIGNIIRDYSIDEFPQFFNVLKGDLSLCGTRPPTVDEWEKYELHHRARLAIKPGITGLWQVSGRSNITDFEEVVELDKKYIREWSMGLDFRILLKTILVVLGKDGSM